MVNFSVYHAREVLIHIRLKFIIFCFQQGWEKQATNVLVWKPFELDTQGAVFWTVEYLFQKDLYILYGACTGGATIRKNAHHVYGATSVMSQMSVPNMECTSATYKMHPSF